MLTFVTFPKPFEDPHIRTIQVNAIQSWTLTQASAQVVLAGAAYGVGELAQRLGLTHITPLANNPWGIVEFGDLLEDVKRVARYETVCFINADIVLPSGFIGTTRAAGADDKMLIGTRTDLDVKEPIDFSALNWEETLFAKGKQKGVPMTAGADYFVFPRSFFQEVPRIFIGRPGIDNWIIWYGRQRGNVCDLTPSVLAIHQNHRPPGEWSRLQGSEETEQNKKIIGEWALSYGPNDANLEFGSGTLRSRRQRAMVNRLEQFMSLTERRLRVTVRKVFPRRTATAEHS